MPHGIPSNDIIMSYLEVNKIITNLDLWLMHSFTILVA